MDNEIVFSFETNVYNPFPIISDSTIKLSSIINIGSGVSYSVSEIINEIQNIIGTNYAVICQNNKRQTLEIQQGLGSRSRSILGGKKKAHYRKKGRFSGAEM